MVYRITAVSPTEEYSNINIELHIMRKHKNYYYDLPTGPTNTAVANSWPNDMRYDYYTFLLWKKNSFFFCHYGCCNHINYVAIK